jgi:hypothetical protein
VPGFVPWLHKHAALSRARDGVRTDLHVAVEIAVRLAVEAILAHDASLALPLQPPALGRPAPTADDWHARYGWVWARRAAAEGAPLEAGPVAPVVLYENNDPLPMLTLIQRSSPRGAFLASLHNPLHWMLASLLLTAVYDRPDRHAPPLYPLHTHIHTHTHAGTLCARLMHPRALRSATA